MADASAPYGSGRPTSALESGEGWGTPTSVRSGAPLPPPTHPRANDALPPELDPRGKRAARAAAARVDLATPAPTYGGADPWSGEHHEHQRPAQRGLPGWGALLVLLVIAGIGGLIDTISGAQVRGGFNYGVVIASVVAILVVRRSAMFPIVIAPPIVYSVASGAMLYVRSSGLHDRKVLFDAAANWLVYGFPAIASATAAVLIIAGIRMLVRR